MPTLGQTISDIASDLNRTDTAIQARIQTALINAIKFYRARRLGFNTKTKVFTISSEYTSLTANFLEIDYAKLQIGTRYKPLHEKDYIWLNERMTFQSLSAEPLWFTVQDRQFRVYPPPDLTYSVEVHMLYDLRDISLSTSDTATHNAWFEEGYELIKTHAQVEVLEHYIQGPDAFATAQVLRNRELQAYNELKRRANREQASGTVKGMM